ncbi:MAG: 4-(cytidine 5'-diphospho)-2-C-methyl-D-erythritol kinase [Clostridia bacterium]|nr:4-(cytidine 5'-diphospho)-2-C-methyl-D-erythritol kinase [Clostridia bacterium]MBR0409004.1 4-(cytidine 5'-diphospho)-2-C-methyl-D-erythritol kinase [Clostridia bacterium]
MEIQARAKINWTLNVVGRRPDGYHLLDMLMQPLALHDTLLIEPSDGLSLKIDGTDGLSANGDNLILRAAKMLQTEAGISSGAAITLTKRIPMGAGLGGGSADAAAALKGLTAFWQLGYDLERLCQIGVRLGADVPFCLHDAPRRAQGIGEILSSIQSRVFPLVLIQPCEALSTKEVFTAYHQASIAPPDTEKAARALAEGNLHSLKAFAGNVLESASIPLRPQIAEAKAALYQSGAAFAQMTGSGSVVFGAYETEQAADRAFEILKTRYSTCIRTATAF